MAFQPAPNIARLDLVWTSVPNPAWVNSLYFEMVDFEHSDMDAALDAIEPVVQNHNFFDFLGWDCQLDRLEMFDIRTADGSFAAEQIDKSGQFQGDFLPLGAAMVVTLNTAKRGRSYRGRVFLSGLGENVWAGTGFTAEAISRGAGFIQAIAGAAEGVGWAHVVLSRQNGGQLRLEALGEPVTRYEVRRAQAGSMRRRNLRG